MELIKNNTKFLLLLTLMSFSAPTPEKIKLYLIGDSTMCLYPISRSPLTGWGMPFANFFGPSVTIDNRAMGGRSTRTFLSENCWKPIADSLNQGDYVLIQFGHNDEAKQAIYADRYTPIPQFKVNLAKFINETRNKKAIPILITPVSRRSFDDQGDALETHKEYSQAVFDVGAQLQVPVIDLDKKSRRLYQSMGVNAAKHLFMELDSAQNPNYPAGFRDNTHFNEYGARRIAELVLQGIREQNIDLVRRVVKGYVKPNLELKSK